MKTVPRRRAGGPATSDAAVVELPTDVRRRIIARLGELDELARLVRERPFSSGWTA